ncbi:threonine--tRNA ligase [Rhodovulum sulfidophilum]|nr:threonine--tRNA ligase [Rhodovulum sulfidophilum]
MIDAEDHGQAGSGECLFHDLPHRNPQLPFRLSRSMISTRAAVALKTRPGRTAPARLPQGEPVKIYRQGDWLDLCRGPHMRTTADAGTAFRLTRVAGAYWRGDSNNRMLSRIYGVAFADKAALDAHITMMAEAEKRDHRRLGREMNLFHFEEVAPGSVFWHPKGWRLFQTLIGYMRDRQEAAGYVEVNSPDIMDRALWETSGHWQNYRANMFLAETVDDREYALKPMNCPGHMLIYGQGTKSYRDLPLKLAEFGKVHRYEPSGALHGLLRVRSFTQDDAHIYCTPEQLTEECLKVNDLVLSIYRDFGFEDVRIKLSTRPENRIGSDESWDRSEGALREALDRAGHPYTIFEGEGAFYGPKLEYVLRDAIGRDWQCGTLQVDFNLPERFGTTYVAPSDEKLAPVMLHRALFGSVSSICTASSSESVRVSGAPWRRMVTVRSSASCPPRAICTGVLVSACSRTL